MFGCPVFALDARLQGQNSIPRWDMRARLGINLGKSPNHGRNVSLVLSTLSGCVLPQFHVIHDDFFETIQEETLTRDITIKYKLLVGFTRDGIVYQLSKHDVIVSKKGRTDQVIHAQNKYQHQLPQQQVAFDANKGPENVKLPQLNDRQDEGSVAEEDAPLAVQLPFQRQSTTARNRTRSGSQVKLPERLIAAMTAMVSSDNQITSDVDTLMDEFNFHDYQIQKEMRDLIAFLSTVVGW